MAITRRERCRLCESTAVEVVLPIRPSPIGDAYIPASMLGKPQERYPLDLYLCKNCGHVQNLDVVDPEILFRDYIFTTSSSPGLVEHFRRYADSIVDKFRLAPDALVVEIGSNDGSLLRFFQQRSLRVLGVDPARQIAQRATETGIPTLPEFFDIALARQIRREHGPAKLVAANNVFAHADDLAEIAGGVQALLADDGVFVFEVSYLADIVQNFLFDTVYHEHVSYHSVAPLVKFFKRFGLELFDVERIRSKGGSIRVFAQPGPEGRQQVEPIVAQLLEAEKSTRLADPSTFRDFGRAIDVRKQALNRHLDAALAQGRMIAGYGASTTVTTLLWHFELTRKLGFLLDDNPRKHGSYSPGCHIPVMPPEEMYIRKPEEVVILAWQYSEPIIRRHDRFLQAGGCFVIPLPDLKIIEK